MKCKIDSWANVTTDDDKGIFSTYRFVGTHESRPFDVTVSFEIDGRDAEYTQNSGLDLRWDSPDDDACSRWDDLLAAFDNTPGLKEDMAAAYS